MFLNFTKPNYLKTCFKLANDRDMKTKKLLTISAVIILSMSAMSAMAFGSFTFQSSNEPSQITIKCGPTRLTEKDTRLPIPANGQRGPLSYLYIKTYWGSPLACDFYEQGSRFHIGYITFFIDNLLNSATIMQSQTLHLRRFKITLSSNTRPTLPINTPAKNITVLITKK